MASRAASLCSEVSAVHMLAAVATAVRCTLVGKKSRKERTASRPPCCSRERECSWDSFSSACAQAAKMVGFNYIFMRHL